MVVRIDPGMAFGSGIHFTTVGCLAILEQVMTDSPAVEELRLLDVGCGSGILAIAGLLMGAKSAVGIDVDTDAVTAACDNAAVNGVSDRFRATAEPLSEASEPYPVVLANILAPTIITLADRLVAAVTPGGTLVLSGILRTQERRVHAVMRRRGMVRFARLRDDDWVALGYHKSGLS